MAWTVDNFPVSYSELRSRVREKAVEIANRLVDIEHLSEEEAIATAVQQAEEWFWESEG